jgi:hypothetical protein
LIQVAAAEFVCVVLQATCLAIASRCAANWPIAEFLWIKLLRSTAPPATITVALQSPPDKALARSCYTIVDNPD